MKPFYIIILLVVGVLGLSAQTNVLLTNTEAENILLGDFNPEDYAPAFPVSDPLTIGQYLAENVLPDSVHSYLGQLAGFTNRNAGSDTVSNTFGIGAARRWAYEKFKTFSGQNQNRLVVSYLQFDKLICTMGRHRNILAILPGQGPQFQEVVLVEAHMDSRCVDECDVNCVAQGIEDNGSGTALVLELARVMSPFAYNRTIVFMITIGEEQGLVGAEAFATWCYSNGVQIKAVLNSDTVGGIICGETSSPPGCPGVNSIDSINVRIFSKNVFDSKHKQLARFTKLEYQEVLEQFMTVKPVINIMTPEDRTGRSGDHIPFRQKGYPAIRFTAANEHGNGDPDGTANYNDRQHTSGDVLGVDTDSNGTIDSFFVDFNYLARNTMINGIALGMAALGPVPPVNYTAEPVNNGIAVSFEDPGNHGEYRVGVRKYWVNDWEQVYTIYTTSDTIYGLIPGEEYAVSVACVDDLGTESLFSKEYAITFTTDIREIPVSATGISLLQNRPNPFDEATAIAVRVDRPLNYKEAFIAVFDIQGRELVRLPIELKEGLNEVIYDFQNHRFIPGTYSYSLVVDGRVVETKTMILDY